MKRHFVALLLMVSSGSLWAQTTLFESMRDANQSMLYVFLDLDMPSTVLQEVAKEAYAAHAMVVTRGFGRGGTMTSARDKVHQIEAVCCQKQGLRWAVDPPLFDRYQIRQTPAYVLVKGKEFSKLAGDMPLSTALRTFYAESKSPAIRSLARVVFNKSFGN